MDAGAASGARTGGKANQERRPEVADEKNIKIDYSVLKTHPMSRVLESRPAPAPAPISTPAREDFDAELLAMVAHWARRDGRTIQARRVARRLCEAAE